MTFNGDLLYSSEFFGRKQVNIFSGAFFRVFGTFESELSSTNSLSKNFSGRPFFTGHFSIFSAHTGRLFISILKIARTRDCAAVVRFLFFNRSKTNRTPTNNSGNPAVRGEYANDDSDGRKLCTRLNVFTRRFLR